MDSAYTRSSATLLILAVLAVPLEALADVGGAVFIKGGAMRLQDDGQVFDITPGHITANADLDRVSNKAIGFGWELRLPRGWAIGNEFLRYNNRFTQLSLPSARGETSTDAFMVSGKKYFSDRGNFHPYIGGGFGIGFTDISNKSSGGPIDDQNTALFLHAMLGVELRVDNLSFMLEARTLYFDVYQRDVEFNPAATGVLLGMGLNW